MKDIIGIRSHGMIQKVNERLLSDKLLIETVIKSHIIWIGE